MNNFRVSELIQLLSDQQVATRTCAMNLLCDSYCEDPSILPAVFQSWDKFGAEASLPEFAILSFVPCADNSIEESCDRSEKMVRGRKLTDPVTRCAGKLIEQLLRLPALSLQPHLDRLQKLVASSKIFFRIHLEHHVDRVQLLQLTADELAGKLDAALEKLCSNPSDDDAMRRAMQSLETLRRQFPEYLDMSALLRNAPPTDGPSWHSFAVGLQSLIHFPEPGLEELLGRHLGDSREAVYSLVVEALVRTGTLAAAQVLIGSFANTASRNQQWIARGMQRLRHANIASQIAQLETHDPHVASMLVLAELRQLDPNHLALPERLRAVPIPAAPWAPLFDLYEKVNSSHPKLLAAFQKARADFQKRLQPNEASSCDDEVAQRQRLRQSLLRELRN